MRSGARDELLRVWLLDLLSKPCATKITHAESYIRLITNEYNDKCVWPGAVSFDGRTGFDGMSYG
jgi:hypothetical protein